MQSLETSEALAESLMAGQAALGTINRLNSGVVIVGPRRRTLFVNEAARSTIEQSAILKFRQNVIRFKRSALDNWLAGHFRQFCPSDNARFVQDGEQQLLFSVQLLPASDFDIRKSVYSLSLNHTPVRTEIEMEKFSFLFSLTARETEVAGLLIGGHTPLMIADSLGVKMSTVRSHTKKIYLKTRVSRQADLIRLGMLLHLS